MNALASTIQVLWYSDYKHRWFEHVAPIWMLVILMHTRDAPARTSSDFMWPQQSTVITALIWNWIHFIIIREIQTPMLELTKIKKKTFLVSIQEMEMQNPKQKRFAQKSTQWLTRQGETRTGERRSFKWFPWWCSHVFSLPRNAYRYIVSRILVSNQSSRSTQYFRICRTPSHAPNPNSDSPSPLSTWF